MTLKAYKTIRGEAASLQIINKSKFLGLIVAVDSIEKANDILKKVQKEHKDANHNCYAYIIGKNQESMKYSDDGEPGGTAGLPMLEVLKKRGLTDVLFVCTRYFGGIKLGSGGLVRAYSTSVSKTLNEVEITTYIPCEIFKVKVDYDIWSKIEKKVKAANAIIFKIEYLESIYLKIGVKNDNKQNIFTIVNQALKIENAFEYIKTDYVESKA